MRRREFFSFFVGVATWPLAARAQQPTMPVVGFIRDGSAEGNTRFAAAFRTGLSESGYVEGQNVKVEYYWLEGQYDRLPALLADLIGRQVALIATPGGAATQAAKAATATIPIVFAIADDPVQLGLVASLVKPGGNVTGINIQNAAVVAKRLLLLHDVLPKAVRIAALVNPGNASVTESTTRELEKAAPTLGLQVHILPATTIGEIDAAFATFTGERPDALFVAPDALFISRRAQLVTLAARDRIPAIYPARDIVQAGGLMSYGVDLAEMLRLVGVYSGNILKGAQAADLPVMQSTKFEFVINLTAARALGLTIPAGVLSIVDDVIE